jgi:hypothetical protein
MFGALVINYIIIIKLPFLLQLFLSFGVTMVTKCSDCDILDADVVQFAGGCIFFG